MKKFLIHIGLFILIPVITLLGLYCITDPYRIIWPFSPYRYDSRAINRDNLSTDFFLYYNQKNHYNSFIIGSSRANGINSYHWRKYLPDNARQFLFQGYCQNISGIEEKVRFIERNGNALENVLIIIDIPGSFEKKQNTIDPRMIRDYRSSGQNKLVYHFWRFFAFLSKPTEWVSAFIKYPPTAAIDTFSNEFGLGNDTVDFSIPPPKECLSSCSEAVRESCIREINSARDVQVYSSEKLINNSMYEKLQSIKQVLDRNNTNYEIIISPEPIPVNPIINPEDLKILEEIFGKEKVHNYSGENEISKDYRYFSDPHHFGKSAGWYMIEEIYGNPQ
jgi:hypothetical protein